MDRRRLVHGQRLRGHERLAKRVAKNTERGGVDEARNAGQPRCLDNVEGGGDIGVEDVVSSMAGRSRDCCKVHDRIGAADQFACRSELREVSADMRPTDRSGRRGLVNADDLMAGAVEMACHVTAEETLRPGQDDLHPQSVPCAGPPASDVFSQTNGTDGVNETPP